MLRPFALVPLALVSGFTVSLLGCVSDTASPPSSSDDAGLDGSIPDATADQLTPDAAQLDAGADSPTADAGPGLWQTATALPVARIQSISAAPGNGYIYVADGYTDESACSGGTADGRVFYAKQNADGSLGPWTENAVGPSGFFRSIPGHADANGYIYVAGGAIDAPSWDGNVWFAKPAADGSIASWTQATNAISTWVGSAPLMTVDHGALYVGAGFNAFASPQNSVNLFVATLDATTGQPGAWTQLANLPEAPSNGQLVISDAGYAYFFNGSNTDVYVAPVAALGASTDAGVDAGSPWTAATALPTTPALPYAVIVGTTLYVAIGGSGDVYASALQADGSLGAWSVYSVAPVSFQVGYQGVLANGFLYVLGDDACGATPSQAAATYYVRFP